MGLTHIVRVLILSLSKDEGGSRVAASCFDRLSMRPFCNTGAVRQP